MLDTLNIYDSSSQLHGGVSTVTGGSLLEAGLPEGWIALALVLFSCLMFRYIRRFFELSVPEMVHFHIAEKHFKENSRLIAYIRRLLFLLSAAVSALFLLTLLRYEYDSELWGLDPIRVYLFILVVFLAACFLKSLTLHLLGFLSRTGETMRMVVYYAQIYVIAGGLLLLPFVILYCTPGGMLYNSLLFIELFVCGVSLLLYLFRTWQIFHASGISIFLWILYLCTLEIVPFLIIYKYISLK